MSGTICLMGGCLLSNSVFFAKISYERRAADMTGYEILSLVIGILTLIIASVTLLLKLFAYLDSRYKRK